MSSAKRQRKSTKEALDCSAVSDTERSMLTLIEEKLKPLESLKKLDILDTLRAEVAELKDMVRKYKTESDELHQSVGSLRHDVHELKTENKDLKDALVELQSRPVRDSLVFSGIPEVSAEENTEDTMKNFLTTHMHVPEDTVDTLTFSRVHRLGTKRSCDPASRGAGPRPIVAKFEYFEQRQFVLSLQKTLQGKRFSISEHFPPSRPDGTKTPDVQNVQTSRVPVVQCPHLKPEVSCSPEAFVVQAQSQRYCAFAVNDGSAPQTPEAACDFSTPANTVATFTHVGWLCGDTVYLNNDQVATPSASALPQKYSNSRICTSNSQQERDEGKQPAKRPLNAYGVFVREQRESVMAEYNVRNVAAVNKILGAKWRALSMQEQFQYYTIAHRESDLESQ